MSAKVIVIAIVVLVVIVAGILATLPSNTIKKDEEVVFYPASAVREGDFWVIPIHGRIYEPERKSIVRNVLLEFLLQTLGGNKEDIEKTRFKERGRLFLEDNERNKRISIQLNDKSYGNKTYKTEKSAPNGHFYGTVKLKSPKTAEPGETLTYKALKVKGDRLFRGICHLLEPEGVSVISDIDDTIKDSQVHDTKETLKKTFFEEFEAIPGMAEVYARWREAGASFHYVSGSPWQLYGPLREFMENKGFPPGDFYLKHVRIKDPETLLKFFKTIELKLDNIEKLMAKYPKRKFILVGDSGEKDPEVYGQIGRKYPDRLIHIYIRNVDSHEEPGESDTPEEDPASRFERVFKDIPKDKWTVFTDPSELKALDIGQL